MATGLEGAKLLVLIDGTGLAGARNVSIPRTNAPLDTSAAADFPDKTYMPGWNDGSLDLDGLYVPNDAAWADLLTAYETGAMVTLSEQEDGAVIYTASAVITGLTKTATIGDTITCSASFQISGGWTAA